MKYLIACLLLASTWLVGCAPMPNGTETNGPEFQPYTVVLEPNLTTNTLDVITPAQGWESAGKQNGWVGFYPETYGAILFTMNELPIKNACTSDSTTTAQWVITKFELTKNGNPQTQKGNNYGTNQTGWIANAFPQMNPANGEALNVSKAEGRISFLLEDLNNDTSQRTAYYQITATRCSDGYSLKTDPGLGNGGR